MLFDVRMTARDYARAYRDGSRTPDEVADAALQAVRQAQQKRQPLDAFVALDEQDVRRQAAESTQRFADNQPLGPLDGVLVAIKDEFDVKGYRTSVGTTFRGKARARHDSAAVARLREAGAIIFGKTAMHEIGFGGTGINAKHITARNPHDLGRCAGGSSSGSAAVVAAGICPLALGSDAGGSVRIPAAFCGIYGLKPTFGRIPTAGGAMLAWSLDHLGPLGASVDDLALFYDATAGAHPDDENSRQAPGPVNVGALRPPPLDSLRIAWSAQMGQDAQAPVPHVFSAAMAQLEKHGARLEERVIPHVDQAQRVGFVTLASEAAASQRDWLPTYRDRYNWDTRLLLAIGARISSQQYLHAQRVRTIVRNEFFKLFADFDYFITPTTGLVAPEITPASLETGEVDSRINAYVSRYTFLGNVTGFPSVTIPCGTDSNGMPIGLMLTGAPWKEKELLNAAAACDQVMPLIARPGLFFDI